MFGFDKGEVQKVILAAIGALALTTVSVGAAVGPARAIETTPVSAFAEAQIAGQAHA